MTDTKKNIKELKASLPRIREKVISVALMLVISLTMIGSVSYAWFTMSSAPEVGSIRTTVSSNGSLEVALAGRYDSEGNLLPPATSSIMDSFSAEGQTTQNANLTWGNLINLSNYYGIENLVLRPATLDLVNSDAFLSSKIYGEDGRVETTATDFGFTQWEKKDEQLGIFDFLYKDSRYYGVRAISSLTYPDGKGELEIKMTELERMYGDVAAHYSDQICKNTTYIRTIQQIVQKYLDANIGAALGDILGGGGSVELEDVDCTEYVPDLYVMLFDFCENAVWDYGEVLAYMASIQTGITYTRETLDQVDVDQVELVGLSEYLNLEDIMDEACTEMDEILARFNNDEIITWNDIEGIIFTLIDIESVKITIAGKTKTVDEWMNDKTTLAGAIFGLREIPVYLNDGAFWKFERLCGVNMNISFQLSMLNMIRPTAKMTTTAADEGQSLYATDKNNTKIKGGTVAPSNKVAADTYGMVLDLWVRTNAANSILTLDGLAKYTETKVPRFIQIIVYDEQGNSSTESRQVYFYNTYTTEVIEGQEIEIATEHLVYADVDTADVDSDGDTTETIYRSTSSRAVAYITETQDDGTEVPRLVTTEDVEIKYDIQIDVNGFQSSNRVDGNYDGMLYEGEISTTQGSGSCYIFYANNPEEAANTLKMLSYLRLAFVDANNNWLADAKLNVDYAFADSGKYIVPIVITNSNCTYTAKDGADKDTTFFGITKLEQNEATLISVVIYLEGSGVENSMVLSGETVTGTLNIQFASTEKLEALPNTDLSTQYLSLSAKINGGLSQTFTYNGNAHKADLVATIDGASASADVRAIFRRKINATQGSIMDAVTLNYVEGTGWVGKPEFTMPGEYVLTGLWIDGVEYNFPEVEGQSTQLTVTVEGFALQSVVMHGATLAFTADNFATRDLTVTFSVDESLQPSNVSARFVSETGEYVTVPMYKDGKQWNGTATFTSSGTYTLTYLVLDGEYYELDETYQRTLTAYLGLYTEVSLVYPVVNADDGTATVDESDETVKSKIYTNRNLSYIYEKQEKVGVMVTLYSDNGEKMEGLENLYLIYADQRNPDFPELGLNARLTWNGECYYGTFNVESAGNYYFAYVRIGDNETIRKATQSPSINAAYPDPPAFDGSETGELVITGNNLKDGLTSYPEAIYKATVQYGPGYTNVVAIFENAAGERVYVTARGAGKSSKGSEYTVYDFEFPWVTDGESSHQNGTWTVVGFEFYDVFDKDNVYHAAKGEEDASPYEVPVAQNKQVTYTVVNEVTVEENGTTLGVDGNGNITGTFMHEYTFDQLSGITIKPAAFGITLDPAWITEMTLTMNHKGDHETYGGYSFSWGSTGYEERSFVLMDPDGDGVFTIVSGDSVYLAGTYQYRLVIRTLTGATYTYEGSNLLTVKSQKPTVTISSISPEGIHTSLDANGEVSVTSRIWEDRHTATVYCDEKKSGSNASITTYPSVTLQLSNIGDAEKVTMVFTTGDAHMYTSYNSSRKTVSGQTGSYVWTQDTLECTRYFGNYTQGGCSSAKKIGAGVLASNTITLTYNGVEYTVTLGYSITIENPTL